MRQKFQGFNIFWGNNVADTLCRLTSAIVTIREKNIFNQLSVYFTVVITSLLLQHQSLAQETLNVPSYYGGTSQNIQASQNSNLQSQQQTSIQNYQNLVNNIQINPSLISQLSESEQVVANPATGELRTVSTSDQTPSGWLRLDVTPTSNGYTLANNSQGGQFSYTIDNQPTMTQFQPGNTVDPNTFQVAQNQQQTPSFSFNSSATANGQNATTNSNNTGGLTQVEAPPLILNETAGYAASTTPTVQNNGGGAPQATFYTAPNTAGAQTTVTNDTQVNVGETTTQTLDNGATSITTPTETVDTQVTTITTADTQTIITETTTTTVTEGTIYTPGTTSTGNVVINGAPSIITEPNPADPIPIPYPTESAASDLNAGSETVTISEGPQVTNYQPDFTPADENVLSPQDANNLVDLPDVLSGPSVTTTSNNSNGTSISPFPDEVLDPSTNSEPLPPAPVPYPTVNVATDEGSLVDEANTSNEAEGTESTLNENTVEETEVVETASSTDNTESSSEEVAEGNSEEEPPAAPTQPSIQTANSNTTSSGPSQAEREAAAARAAEEERRRREENIRMQREASGNRLASQNRAMQLLENDVPMGMSGDGGLMNGADGMTDPNRMSIFNQNARIRSEGGAANVSTQIASLSNTMGSINDVLGDEGAEGLFAPCPSFLAGACAEAANKLADDLDKEIKDAKEKGEKKVNDELDEVDKGLDDNGERAEKEKDRRDNRSDRQKAIDKLKEEQEKRAEDLNDEGDELDERGKEQQERRTRLEEEERDLRKQEQDARRNGDPNCRGPECRAIREQRQQNSRDTTNLAREEGQFQADQARFQGKVQDFQRRQANLDKMQQGDPRYEIQRARNAAHQNAADAQSNVDRLKEEQLNLRRQGGSGSKQDRAYDRAIERAERIAQAASNNAELADRMALKAEFYANGMQNEWESYENARKASDAFNNFLDANNEAADLRERTSNAQDVLDAARRDPDFDPDSLESLEEEVDSLRSQLNNAQDALKQYSADVGDTTEALTGNRLSANNQTSRLLSKTLGDISNEFAERQRLSNLSDADLANEIDMINEAKERVAAARNGLNGSSEDPGGRHTDRFNALKAEQAQLQENIDNFNPMGSGGTGIVYGADEAYRNMQSRLDEVENELSGMNVIDVANSAFERVDSHNEWAEGLTEGLPLNADGTINRTAFTRQVGEMAQAQTNLVNANNNLETAKNELAQAKQNGDNEAIANAQSTVDQYNVVISRITDQIAENNVNVTTGSDGRFAISANSVGASATWTAAAEGVSKAQLETENQERQFASAAGTTPSPNAPVQARETDVNSQSNTNVTRERDANAASEPVTVTEPPLNGPGGFYQSVINTANEVAKQAEHGAAVVAASKTKPKPSIADQQELVKSTTQEARERRGQASVVENDIEQAKFAAEIARNEAEFQRGQAEQNTTTRERQADEYVDFAKNAEERADKNRSKAEELENQATKLRESAARFNAIADSTDDRKLARDARSAAKDNLENASQRDEKAQEYRNEADSDDKRAAELAARENEIRDDATNLETRAKAAEEEAEKAEAEVARLESEASRLNSEAAKLDQLATTQANDLAETQRTAFNEIMKNPPDGWKWSSLNSSERSNWLTENVPQWRDLSTDQRIEVLQKLELAEAAHDFVAQNSRYEEFHNSDQGKRSTPEMLESRARDLTNLETRLKELNDMTFWNDEEEAEAKKLKEGLETGSFRLRADQRARAAEETLRYEAWQEQNRKLWAVNDEKRAAEVQRNVDTYSDLQARVGDARNIQAARTAAFDTREVEINNRINNPINADDAEAARGELERLKEARKYWSEFDARTVAGSEAIAAEARSDITYYGFMNGLGEIGTDEGLDERANAKLMSDSALNSRRLDTANNIQTAVNGIDFTEPDPNVWESIITGYDMTAEAVQDTGVAISATAGGLYGIGEGVVKGAYGIVDILIIQPIDFDLEVLQLYANDVLGTNVDIVGTETIDAVNSIGESNFGELGMKFVIGEGKKIADGLNRLDSAFDTGSLTDAFVGTSDVTAVGTELFVDPTLAVGIGGKVITVLRGIDKVDDVAQVVNVLGDAAVGADAIGDVSRTGGVVIDTTRSVDIVGDSVRFADTALAPELTGGVYRGLDEILGPDYVRAFGETPRAPVAVPQRPAPLRPTSATNSRSPVPLQDGPLIGFDELMGSDFMRALDDAPISPAAVDSGVPYRGFDEIMGSDFANAFGTTPRTPVFPPSTPSPLRPGAGANSAPLPSRDGPLIGFDELMGPDFVRALDGPATPRAFTPDGLPYRGLDEFLGPDFANALGVSPRPPVYPPVRPSPLRSNNAGVGNTPSTPAPSRTGPPQGFDELMGSDFVRAFDDVPNIPRDPFGIPYQGIDEILGPDFARAFGEVPRAPVYPPARPSPLRPGTGNAPTTPQPARNEPFKGLDEMLGTEFRNAFDDPFPGSFRDGPGGTAPLSDGPIGAQPFGGANGAGIPPTRGGGNIPPTRGSANIPPTDGRAVSPSRAARAELDTFRDGAPAAANSNEPLLAANAASNNLGPNGTLRNGPSSGFNASNNNLGPNGTLPNGPSSGFNAPNNNLGPNGTLPNGANIPGNNLGPNGTLPNGPANAVNAAPVDAPAFGAGDNILAGPNGTDIGQLPPGVFRTADGIVQVPVRQTPIVTARQAGNFIVLEDTVTGSRQILELGNELGRGSFTIVNELKGTGSGNVSKISKEVDPITARLDDVGTTAYTDLPKVVKDNFLYTPEPRGEYRVAAANDNAALAGKNIRIAEQAPVPTYSQTRGPRAPMTPEEVNSITRAQELITDTGHVSLDLKSNNFGFQDLPNGLKRTIVHDAGGTVPTIGNTAAERAANAKIVQRALMTPDQSLVNDFKQAMNAYDNYKAEWTRAVEAGDEAAAFRARTNLSNAANRAFDITSGHGRAVLAEHGHLIDEARLGVPLEEIGFNPVLGFNQDGVRAAAARAAANDNLTGFMNASASGF